MPLSRLRLRLAGSFALAFALSLGFLAAGALGYLWRESNRRLDTRLTKTTESIAQALARELHESPDSSFAYAANEVVKEWPPEGDAFAIADTLGRLIAGVDRDRQMDRVLGGWGRQSGVTRLSLERGGPDLRVIGMRNAFYRARAHEWHFEIVAFGSTEGIESDTQQLGGAFAVIAPLIALLSLMFGYLLSRRALRPVHELSASIAAIAPSDLSHRIPVGDSPDEIGGLALEFNALLQRLDEAQRRNVGFVREAAHQIRTPLTLVLGEAAHAIDGAPRDREELAATLARVRIAAEQMRRRVDELFLLAEAEAGERIILDSDVELDGVALECTDLMRGRAASLNRALALGEVAPAVVRGNAPLLREALLELLENACRHGGAAEPVTTSVRLDGANAIVEVTSAFDIDKAPDQSSRGLGTAIVRWIAEGHGGRFEGERVGDRFRSRLVIPAVIP
jgi:signal transduction histidine kinase